MVPKEKDSDKARLKDIFKDRAKIAHGEYVLRAGVNGNWAETAFLYHDREVKLTPGEKRVMALLVENKGEPVTARQFGELFGHTQSDKDERLLASRVSSIRKKIQRDHPVLPKPQIHSAPSSPESSHTAQDKGALGGYFLRAAKNIQVPPPPPLDTISFGPFSMNKPYNRPWEDGMLWVGGVEVSLNPKQNKLMSRLIEKQGSPLFPEDLKDVFKSQKSPNPDKVMNTYKVQIGLIRAAIVRDTGHKDEADLITRSFRTSLTPGGYHLKK